MILALSGVPLVIVSIIAFVLIIGVIILVHEGGHFFFAKKAGILCHEFSIGMGPVLYKKQWGETTICIRAIPIGGFVSMAGEEIASDPTMRMPSRKSSLDITAFLPLESDSPINNVDSSSVDEVPCLSLPPSQIKREKSFSDLLQEEAYRLRAVECKKRRLLRMEILRKKRQQGLIDFGHTIRYKQRSDLATKRVRSSGKFVSEYNYKNA